MPHGQQGHQPGSKSHAARVKARRQTARGKKVEAKGENAAQIFLSELAEEKNYALAQVTQVSGGGRFKLKFSEGGADVTATMLAGAKLHGKKILNSNAATKVGDFVIALWSKEANAAHQKQGTEIQGKVPSSYIKAAKKRAKQLGYSWSDGHNDDLFERASNSSRRSKSQSQSNSTRKRSKSQSKND